MHKPPHQYDPEYNRNLMLAFAIICVMMGFWYYFYEIPHRHALEEQQAKAHAAQTLKQQETQKLESNGQTPAASNAEAQAIIEAKPKPREDVITQSPRIEISNGRLHGSINLKGARLDDISLTQYKQTLDKNSPDAAILSPPGTEAPEFIETGWISGDKSPPAPNADTIWQVEGNSNLTPSTPVTLTWDNGQGFKFLTKISVDDHYMFSLTQSVENHSDVKASFFPYGLISKSHATSQKPVVGASNIGAREVSDNDLIEMDYDVLRDGTFWHRLFHHEAKPDNAVIHRLSDDDYKPLSWLAFSDTYWANALIPPAQEKFKTNFIYSIQNAEEKFQVNYLGQSKTIAPGETINFTPKIFTGVKELKTLENYRDNYHLQIFDELIDFRPVWIIRQVDFGWFYILAHSLMLGLIYFYKITGTVGLAILLLTFCVKICLFPLARKSYISMGRMRDLNPKMQKLREQYKDDKMELNKQVMTLYKTEGVNPASGCLPVLLQIPIFFALIKVFNVSIEMRHTPFYGWIHDLSAPDPTSVFNLFGLIHISLPAAFMIGAWPCIWACTMFIQQKLTPVTNMDPTQAKMMKLLPIVLVFAFSKVAAGLVIYYAFSNTLTIFQQLYFLKYHGKSDYIPDYAGNG